jgi:hypothetical protein
MVDAQTVSIVFAGVSIGIAAIYYAMTLRNANRAREAQMLMAISSNFYGWQFSKSWSEFHFNIQFESPDEFWDKYGPRDNIEDFNKTVTVMQFFESMGLLVKKNLIDIEDLYEFMGGYAILIWNKMWGVIKEYRERIGSNETWRNYEYLVDRFIEIAKRRSEYQWALEGLPEEYIEYYSRNM